MDDVNYAAGVERPSALRRSHQTQLDRFDRMGDLSREANPMAGGVPVTPAPAGGAVPGVPGAPPVDGAAHGGGMASGGKFDARHGGPVPPGPPGVDRVPARMSNGETMLDADPGATGATEVVVPADVASKNPDLMSYLEFLRQTQHDPNAVEMRRAVDGEGGKGLAGGSRASEEEIDKTLGRLRASRGEGRVMDRNIAELPQMRAEAAEMSETAGDMAIGLASPAEKKKLLQRGVKDEVRGIAQDGLLRQWGMPDDDNSRMPRHIPRGRASERDFIGKYGAAPMARPNIPNRPAATTDPLTFGGSVGKAASVMRRDAGAAAGAVGAAASAGYDAAKDAYRTTSKDAKAAYNRDRGEPAKEQGGKVSASTPPSSVTEYAGQQRAAGTSNPGTDLTGSPNSIRLPSKVDGRTASLDGAGPARPSSMRLADMRASRDKIRAQKHKAIDIQDRQDSLSSGDPGTAFVTGDWENSPEGLAQYRRQVEAAGGRMLPDGRVEVIPDQPITGAGAGDYVRRAGGREAMGGMSEAQINDPEYLANLRRSAQNAEPTEAEAQAAMQRNLNAAKADAGRSMLSAYRDQRGGSRSGIGVPDGATAVGRGSRGEVVPGQPVPPVVRRAMASIDEAAAPPEQPSIEQQKLAWDITKTGASNMFDRLKLDRNTREKMADIQAKHRGDTVKATNEMLSSLMEGDADNPAAIPPEHRNFAFGLLSAIQAKNLGASSASTMATILNTLEPLKSMDVMMAEVAKKSGLDLDDPEVASRAQQEIADLRQAQEKRFLAALNG